MLVDVVIKEPLRALGAAAATFLLTAAGTAFGTGTLRTVCTYVFVAALGLLFVVSIRLGIWWVQDEIYRRARAMMDAMMEERREDVAATRLASDLERIPDTDTATQQFIVQAQLQSWCDRMAKSAEGSMTLVVFEVTATAYLPRLIIGTALDSRVTVGRELTNAVDIVAHVEDYGVSTYVTRRTWYDRMYLIVGISDGWLTPIDVAEIEWAATWLQALSQVAGSSAVFQAVGNGEQS